jgi:hypothetical protein
MKLSIPPQTAPATTSEQFARALRNAALTNLDRDLAAARADYRAGVPFDYVPFLGAALLALEACVAECARADRFAPEGAPTS